MMMTLGDLLTRRLLCYTLHGLLYVVMRMSPDRETPLLYISAVRMSRGKETPAAKYHIRRSPDEETPLLYFPGHGACSNGGVLARRLLCYIALAIL